MAKYFKQSEPFVVPTDDGKLIEEHFGNASNYYDSCSIARMEMPPRSKFPWQNPEFDEFLLITRGKMLVRIDGEKVYLKTGESLLIKQGVRVRHANPFDEPLEYWSICLPPFSLITAKRES